MPAVQSRRQIKQTLLCRPTHFNVDYIINPHMQPYSVDTAKAMRQWEQLVAALEKLDISVQIIDQQPDVPDMVFATDQGIVRGKNVLLANFRFGERQRERPYYRDWFKTNGYELLDMANAFPLEGGDALPFGDTFLLGTGFRSNIAACEELSQLLNCDVIPLSLVDPYFYHLDMALLPIDDETAFYYPPAFSDNSRALLQRLIPNLHVLSKHDVAAYAANSLVSGDNILISAGTSQTFQTDLKSLGLQPYEVDVSEFKKAGGGIHCLINTLE